MNKDFTDAIWDKKQSGTKQNREQTNLSPVTAGGYWTSDEKGAYNGEHKTEARPGGSEQRAALEPGL